MVRARDPDCTFVCFSSINAFGPRLQKVVNSQNHRWSMVTRTKKIFVGGLSAPTTLEDVKSYFEQFGPVPCSIAELLEGVQSLGLRHIASPKPSECHRSLIFIVHRSGAVITSVVGWLPLGAVFSGFTPGPGSTMAGRKQGERSQNFPLVSQRRKMPSWQYLGVGMGWTIK
uniref:RRM domain-containing protein n=1 Tax=Anopheles albimanus TaxID=7167 RepID=A0A182FD24_ANOAL